MANAEMTSFTFNLQGTNAHAVLVGASTSKVTSCGRSSNPWQRKRMWYGLPAYVLLEKSLHPARGMLNLQTSLNRANLAYLWDHQVRASSDF